ncbi:uncharacterized protein N7443_007121 [Penicillium atrosanguineum]|uniref:uncharacterized protein n=1 Tax=Penicillium atrosanguineum TaxID=1132637 RepID=UPI00239E634B|nr:uncharacterized protein N7443_007121 [Penicillium atrosanguineum]KAJ5296228.1 hypothetical protein N7443_007121 [Penicillium atrosanguineum]
MRLLSLSILLLAAPSVEVAAYTLDQVEAQFSSYLQLAENGLLSTRGQLPFGCTPACGFLEFALPSQISYPNSTTYSLKESTYWSQQQALTEPTCRFSPESALDVSFAVLTLQVAQCEFAVKSGGMTIDLANLNEITVRSDRAQTAVGAGNVWYDVYTTLQPMGLTVIGGRVSAIGVGGLTLGGGISFFSGRYGWACDNVNNYEVVLADGSIQEVSFSSPYSDLYWALRGGGNNFGIVTRFDLMTFPQGDLWAGSETFIYTPETAAAINDAFYFLGVNAPSDPYAQVITAYAYAQSVDAYIIASDLQYGKPVANPPILQNFTAVQGAIASTLRIVDQANLTIEFNDTNPGGFRQTYWTLMVGNNATLMADMVAIYMDEIEPLKSVAGLVPSLVFQPITTDMILHFSKNGGNALGLDNQGPLNLVQIDISWSDIADDDRILTAAQNILDGCQAAASAVGLLNKYLYQNYASVGQGVFSGYGQNNLARLKAVSAKYDPAQVFQKLQPGYFKLN